MECGQTVSMLEILTWNHLELGQNFFEFFQPKTGGDEVVADRPEIKIFN